MPKPIYREKFPVARAVSILQAGRVFEDGLIGILDEIDFYMRATERLKKHSSE